MKHTFITGASSGLGREFAKLYAKDNNNLILLGTNLHGLEETKQIVLDINPNINIELIIADLSNYAELERVYSIIKEKGYFINNLINNAGFGDRCDFKDMDIDFQIKMTNVNCNALLYFTKVFLDDMLKNNEGHIINVGSIAGFVPGPYMSTYHATKSYVLSLGEAIAHEIRKTNVKILTLCPGPFNSRFVEKAKNGFTFKKIKPIEASEVALIGYKASMKGKRVKIVGTKNWLTMFITRFFSRRFVASSSAKTLKKE